MRLLFLAMMEDRDGLTEALGCVLNLNYTEELVFDDDKLGRIYQVWSLSVAAYTLLYIYIAESQTLWTTCKILN